jgi:hypothetical protein
MATIQKPPPPLMTEKILKNNTITIILEFINNKTDIEKKAFYKQYANKYKNTDKLLETIEKCKSLEEHKEVNLYLKNKMADFNINYTAKKVIKKKPISAAIKRLVWNANIGENIGKAKCLCCKVTDITQMSFNCGHIIAEANGGELIVSNLKPICQNCNSSMGTQNMNEFMKSFK